MQNKIIQGLNWRYATKVFNKNKKINSDDFKILTESLRLSPSSFGLQPWKFFIIKNAEIREKIKEVAYGQSQVTDASELIVMCAKTTIVENDIDKLVGDNVGYKNVILGAIYNKSELEMQNWNARQVYIALGFLLETCALLQIDSCPMEGFDNSKIDEILKLKENGLTSVLLCPVGYRSDDDKYASKIKTRFLESEIIEVLE